MLAADAARGTAGGGARRTEATSSCDHGNDAAKGAHEGSTGDALGQSPGQRVEVVPLHPPVLSPRRPQPTAMAAGDPEARERLRTSGSTVGEWKEMHQRTST